MLTTGVATCYFRRRRNAHFSERSMRGCTSLLAAKLGPRFVVNKSGQRRLISLKFAYTTIHYGIESQTAYSGTKG